MTAKRALITGVTGQDGSYLAELLLGKGYEVHGLIRELEPDEIYHLAAQSHVRVSFDMPEYTCETPEMGTVGMLEAVRASGVWTRFYQAPSSEMFGAALPRQSDKTPFHPRSPYGVGNLFAY